MSILLLPGAIVILLGVGKRGALLLPPHPAKGPKRKEKSATVNRPEQNRRMHPPRLPALAIQQTSLCICLKFLSVEASRDFSKGDRPPACDQMRKSVVDDARMELLYLYGSAS
jgi:hypothetical protein